MTKKPVCVRMDGDLWKAFQKFVSDKTGKIWGDMGKELSYAISAYMASGGSTHEHTDPHQKFKIPKRAQDTTKEIYDELCRRMGYEKEKVTRVEVHEAISAVVSADPRMLRKYMGMLETLGYIKLDKFGIYFLPMEIARKEARGFLSAVARAEGIAPKDKELEAG